MKNSGWHAICKAGGVMRRSRPAAKRLWRYLSLGVVLLLTTIIPAPHSASVQSNRFTVMGGDYVSQLIASPRGVHALNSRMTERARFAGYDQISTLVGAGSTRDFALVTRYSGDLLSVLGVEYLLRGTPASEDHPVFISECFWKRVLGETPDVLGRTVEIGSETFEIAGVVRPHEDLVSETEVWVPLSSRGPYGAMTSMRVVGELRPGVDWSASEKELSALMRADSVKELVIEVDKVRLLPFERKLVLSKLCG